MSDSTQFRLLGQRKFGPLFVTQLFGAFNDNLYKSALGAIFVFSQLVLDTDEDLYVNLAAGLFILPFFLFSATAGTLADRYEKSRLMRYIKFAEIGVALLIAAALYLRNVWAMLFVLFLLGAQSTFFGPLKFAILPQHLRPTELVGGNGVIEMGTFVAILIGTIVGSVIGGMQANVTLGLTILVVCVAVAGFLSCLLIPNAPSVFKGKAGWNPFVETYHLIQIASEKEAVIKSVLGISWFWTLGSVYIAQFPKLTEAYLVAGPDVFTLLLAVITIAIAIGSLTCERLSGGRIEIGLVPVGAFGVSVLGIDLYFAIESINATDQRSLMEFLRGSGSIRLLADMGLMGFFLGLYVVPLQTAIQARTPLDRRARVIAANNVINSICIVAGAGLSILWLTVFKFSIPTLFLLMAILNIVVSAYIFLQVPEFTLRFIVWMLSHSAYRVKHVGFENIPERGPALVVCNHVSYLDALFLAGAVRRPIRFVMSKEVYDTRFLNYIFRAGKTIPIVPRSEDLVAYEKAFEEIREALEEGDLLCIFPEGKLTKDGEIDEFRPGTLKILQDTPVTVIPAALRGLWGSFFTHHGKGLFKGSTRLWSKIDVVISQAIAPENVEMDQLRNKVIELRGERA